MRERRCSCQSPLHRGELGGGEEKASVRYFRLLKCYQWEYACRAGTATPLFYGGLDADFSKLANLADLSLDKMAVSRGRRAQ